LLGRCSTTSAPPLALLLWWVLLRQGLSGCLPESGFVLWSSWSQVARIIGLSHQHWLFLSSLEHHYWYGSYLLQNNFEASTGMFSKFSYYFLLLASEENWDTIILWEKYLLGITNYWLQRWEASVGGRCGHWPVRPMAHYSLKGKHSQEPPSGQPLRISIYSIESAAEEPSTDSAYLPHNPRRALTMQNDSWRAQTWRAFLS
jgi:hypothetical protein